MERYKMVAARLTEREYHKLATLAKATDRSVSAVLREFIRRAEVAAPDIRLKDPSERRPGP